MERKICALMLLTLATLAAVIGCLELFVSAGKNNSAVTPDAEVVATPTLAFNATANEFTAVSDLLDIYNGLNRQTLKTIEGSNEGIDRMAGQSVRNITIQFGNGTDPQSLNVQGFNVESVNPTLKSAIQNNEVTQPQTSTALIKS